MHKFKVGQRVRIQCKNCSNDEVAGWLGRITDIDKHDDQKPYKVKADKGAAYDFGLWHHEDCLAKAVELDTERMIKEIAELVRTDFSFDMDCKLGFEREFTQEEARHMAHLLGRVYSISHCITCDACQTKYIR